MKPQSLLFFIVLAAFPAFASDETSVDLERLRAQYRDISRALEERRPPYDALTDADRAGLQTLHQRAVEIVSSHQSYDQLDAQERKELDEVTHAITAAASTSAEDRLICRRERRRDSHLTIRVCKTGAQMRRERDDARNLLDQRGQCINSMACGGK